MVNFHIEPTSKCTLECPLCDRTWFYETFKKRNLHEIDVDNIVKFVGPNVEVTLCGNNGDPIYHSKFLDLCQKLKNNNCSIWIHTNGSARPTKWWERLKNILGRGDHITFAIDGLEDTNHLYRKNAKWKSIMTAIKTLKDRNFNLVWKFIIFKHNQHQILEAKRLSEELTFDEFELEQSDRWLGKKDLMPDPEYVDYHYKYQKEVLINPQYSSTMKPKCLINNLPSNSLYIDAEGDFYPCCWMGTYKYKLKSIFKSKMNIATHSLNEILENKKVIDFFNTTKDFKSAHECCKIQCGGR